jgi:hypothetical protein
MPSNPSSCKIKKRKSSCKFTHPIPRSREFQKYFRTETRPNHSKLRSYIKWRFFVVAAMLIKPKQQHEKDQNINTSLFINCMDFFCCAYRNKQKNKIVIFMGMLGPCTKISGLKVLKYRDFRISFHLLVVSCQLSLLWKFVIFFKFWAKIKNFLNPRIFPGSRNKNTPVPKNW